MVGAMVAKVPTRCHKPYPRLRRLGSSVSCGLGRKPTLDFGPKGASVFPQAPSGCVRTDGAQLKEPVSVTPGTK